MPRSREEAARLRDVEAQNGPLTKVFLWWALRDSNPRPSPCKGDTNVQVRALSSGSGVPLSTSEYLGVPSACYADVMQSACTIELRSSAGRSPRSSELVPLRRVGESPDARPIDSHQEQVGPRAVERRAARTNEGDRRAVRREDRGILCPVAGAGQEDLITPVTGHDVQILARAVGVGARLCEDRQ